MSILKYFYNLLIQESKINKLFILFICFVFSAFIYFMTGLLYAWGSPDWFNLFPETFGFRFLLAISVFSLCCISFFCIRFIFLNSFNRDYYWRVFAFSFIPIYVFSVFIFYNAHLQVLQTLTGIIDSVIWFVLLFLFYKYPWTFFPLEQKGQIRRLWIYCSTLQFVLEILYLFSVVSGLFSISIRLLLFIICFFITGTAILFHKSEDLHEIALRFNLTKREAEVLSLLVSGKSNNEIAELLFISLSTVKTHISVIFEKTGTRNRLEAANLSRNI